MPILIDGHNLIPKIDGLTLRDLDDEIGLIRLLQEYARLSKKTVEVFFDNAQPGQVRTQKYGSVAATFVRAGLPADEEIRVRLQKLGKAARNWVVVSSDTRVQMYARSMYARVKSSESFAQELRIVLNSPTSPGQNSQAEGLNEAEVAEWLEFFRQKPPKK